MGRNGRGRGSREGRTGNRGMSFRASDSRGYLESAGVEVAPDDDGKAAEVRGAFYHDQQHRAEHYEGLNEIGPYHCAQAALQPSVRFRPWRPARSFLFSF